MFIPLYDGVPLRHIRAPMVTYLIIAVCVALQAGSLIGVIPPVEPLLAAGFGIIPMVVLGQAYLPADIAQVPAWVSPVTSLFLHAGLAHLAGNMLFLWVFGDNVEDYMGSIRFAVFYLACGIAACLAHMAVNSGSTQPLIGASGAISGVIAAYVLLHPRVTIWGLVLKYVPLPLPAWVAIGGWIGVQVFQAVFGSASAVAWFAHLGGLLAGLGLTPVLLRRGQTVKARWAR